MVEGGAPPVGEPSSAGVYTFIHEFMHELSAQDFETALEAGLAREGQVERAGVVWLRSDLVDMRPGPDGVWRPHRIGPLPADAE